MDRSQSSVIPKDLQLNIPTPLYLSKMLFTDVQLLLYSKKKTTTTTTQGYVRQVVGGKMAAAEMSGELSVSNIVVEKVMPNKLKCPFCFDKCLAERGFCKHVILCHGM